MLCISYLYTNLPIRMDNSLIHLNKIRFFIPVFISNLNFCFYFEYTNNSISTKKIYNNKIKVCIYKL
jgi:hypothetical protein